MVQKQNKNVQTMFFYNKIKQFKTYGELAYKPIVRLCHLESRNQLNRSTDYTYYITEKNQINYISHKLKTALVLRNCVNTIASAVSFLQYCNGNISNIFPITSLLLYLVLLVYVPNSSPEEGLSITVSL